MFKIGDKIIAKEKVPDEYTITSAGTICEVIKIHREGIIEVKVLKYPKGHKYYNTSKYKRSSYIVESSYFKILGVPNNSLSKLMYPDYVESSDKKHLIPRNHV